MWVILVSLKHPSYLWRWNPILSKTKLSFKDAGSQGKRF